MIFSRRLDPEPPTSDAPLVLDPLQALMGEATTPSSSLPLVPAAVSPPTSSSSNFAQSAPSISSSPIATSTNTPSSTPTTTTTTSTTTPRPPASKFRFPTQSPQGPTLLPPGVTASTTRMTTSSSSVGFSLPAPPPFTVVSRRTTSSTSVSASSRVHIQTPISQFSLNHGGGSQQHPAPHLRPSLLRLAAQGKKTLQLETLETPTQFHRNLPENSFQTPPISSPSSPLLPSTRQPPPNFEDVLRLPRSNPDRSSLERTLRHFRHLYKRNKRQTDTVRPLTNRHFQSSRRRQSQTTHNLDGTLTSFSDSNQRRNEPNLNSVPLLDSQSNFDALPNLTSDHNINVDSFAPTFSRNLNIANTRRKIINNPNNNDDIAGIVSSDTGTNRPLGRITSRGRFRFIRKEEQKKDRARQAATPSNPLTQLRRTQQRSRPSTTATTNPIATSSSSSRRRPQVSVSSSILRPTPVKVVTPLLPSVVSRPDQQSQSIDPQTERRQHQRFRIRPHHQHSRKPQTQQFSFQSEPVLREDTIVHDTTTEAAVIVTEPPIVYPETNFSCDGKVLGGLYADVEADCNMFHICSLELDGR